MEIYKVGVLITTSSGRLDLLLNRSLSSVLNQSYQPDCIVIVNDYREESEFQLAEYKINNLSSNLKIFHIPNARTKFMSGTGAWNTGIEFLSKEIGKDSFVAILDDDDQWDRDYLMESVNKINESDKQADVVVSYLKRSDCEEPCYFDVEDLTINNFLIGNPGIQGSNMFFRIDVLLKISGFDETLNSCTDRDLMIRIIENVNLDNFLLTKKVLVNHYSWRGSVTNNFIEKKKGLNMFYEKHINRFCYEILLKSLERAERLFGYTEKDEILAIYNNLKHKKDSVEVIAIGIAMHNNAGTIRRCIQSILNQKKTKREVRIVIANDNSIDNWLECIADLLNFNQQKIIVNNVFHNNVVKTRNYLNSYIVKNINEVQLILRLDADDEFYHNDALIKIEEILDKENPDYILAGNSLRKNNVIIERINQPCELLKNKSYLLQRLYKMTKCDEVYELPSCNLIMRPHSLKEYPEFQSAEDHALLTSILLESDNHKIHIAKDILLTCYDLGGETTMKNRKSNIYRECRKDIYNKAKEYVER